MEIKPRITKIFSNDYFSILFLIAIVVSWGMYLYLNAGNILPDWRRGTDIKPENAGMFLIMAIVATAAGVPLIALRIAGIYGIFRHGVEVQGIITSVVIFKDRGRLEYRYTYEGVEYNAGMGIHKSRDTEGYGVNDVVTLVVSASSPKKALIKDLFV